MQARLFRSRAAPLRVVRRTVRARSVLLITGLAVAGALIPGTATAAPIDNGRFTDSSTELFDCDGTPVHRDSVFHVNFLLNQRGSSPFAYYRESVKGKEVFTNLDTGGTYTAVFSVNTKDHKITDNGDGTITVLGIGTGGARWYDANGKLVLNDPGQTRFSVDIDYNGTPSNLDDDTEVPGSFQVVRPSTGRNDTAGRDFCTDLIEFTS